MPRHRRQHTDGGDRASEVNMQMCMSAAAQPISQQKRFYQVEEGITAGGEVPTVELKRGAQSPQHNQRPREQDLQQNQKNRCRFGRLEIVRTGQRTGLKLGMSLGWFVDRSHVNGEAESSELRDFVEEKSV